MTVKKKCCKDCGSVTRVLSKPGPRCATCWRAKESKRKAKEHGQYIFKTYGVTIEQYNAQYEYQGGRCAICQRATGATKRLAVDHDHKTGEFRGLLCSICNSALAMFARNDPEVMERGAEYLRNPPARVAAQSVFS